MVRWHSQGRVSGYASGTIQTPASRMPPREKKPWCQEFASQHLRRVREHRNARPSSAKSRLTAWRWDPLGGLGPGRRRAAARVAAAGGHPARHSRGRDPAVDAAASDVHGARCAPWPLRARALLPGRALCEAGGEGSQSRRPADDEEEDVFLFFQTPIDRCQRREIGKDHG